VSRVELVHSLTPCATAAALELEAAAAAAFEAEARALGLAAGVKWVWGATLHHPSDVCYTAFSGAKPPKAAQPQAQAGRPEGTALGAGAAAGCSGQQAPWVQPTEQRHVDEREGPRPNADTQRYRCLPNAMTQFRKALQTGPAPRLPLPPPDVLPPLPPGVTGSGGEERDAALPRTWWAPLPRDVFEVYEAAGPEAVCALRRLAKLTGCAALAVPGAVVPSYAGGMPDGRSAFPFSSGEAAAGKRLAQFLRGQGSGRGGSGGNEGVGDGGSGETSRPLEGFVNAR
jgi:hypothetical protein